jgi:hypothetical protein
VKPILFLDVDGVLNACPPIEGEPVTRKLGFPICIPTGTKERVARLSEEFEMVWATTWRDKAHPNFGEDLGLGEEWPHVDFHDLKILSILEYAVQVKLSGTIVQPWVWIDDDAPWEMQTVGLRHDESKTLVLAPDTAVGLTDGHVQRALDFAARLKGDS